MEIGDKLYRYEDRIYWRETDFEGMMWETHDPQCMYFFVKKITPRGCWIDLGFCGTNLRFIRDKGKKKYAYPSKAEALRSYVLRKEWQVVHAKRAYSKAKALLVNAKDYQARPWNNDGGKVEN